MRASVNISALLLSGVLALLYTTSCRKTLSNEDLIANAGKNDTIYGNKAELNGTFSSGKITRYEWTKISGPASYNIDDPSSASTVVTNLEKGSYEFKLTITGKSGAGSSAIKRLDVMDPELDFENLTWENDLVNKMLFVQIPQLPNFYSVNRITMVYLFGGSVFPLPDAPAADWFPIPKNGTGLNEFYYKIENSRVVAYEYYDVFPNNPFWFIGNKVKILFE